MLWYERLSEPHRSALSAAAADLAPPQPGPAGLIAAHGRRRAARRAGGAAGSLGVPGGAGAGLYVNDVIVLRRLRIAALLVEVSGHFYADLCLKGGPRGDGTNTESASSSTKRVSSFKGRRHLGNTGSKMLSPKPQGLPENLVAS